MVSSEYILILNISFFTSSLLLYLTEFIQQVEMGEKKRHARKSTVSMCNVTIFNH